MKIEPIHSKPALIITSKSERILVIADTHIGIEYGLLDSGFRIPPQSEIIIDNFMKLCEIAKPSRIIHLGDVKHNIPIAFYDERKALQQIIESALSVCESIDIVPGNHDGNIEMMLADYTDNSKVRLQRARGFSIGDTGFFHGHTWPLEEVIKKRNLVISHIHPAVLLTDTLGRGETKRCWLRGTLDLTRAMDKYTGMKSGNGRRIIVVPAFNELCGSALNRSKTSGTGPLVRNGLLSLSDSEIYLLDGTALGKLSDLTLFCTARRAEH